MIWIIQKNKMPLQFQNVPKLKIIWICSPAGLAQPVSSAFCICLLFKNFLALSFFFVDVFLTSEYGSWRILTMALALFSSVFFLTTSSQYGFFSSVSVLQSDSYFELCAICFFCLWVRISSCMSDTGITHSYPATNIQYCLCTMGGKVCPKRSLHGQNRRMR